MFPAGAVSDLEASLRAQGVQGGERHGREEPTMSHRTGVLPGVRGRLCGALPPHPPDQETVSSSLPTRQDFLYEVRVGLGGRGRGQL